MTAKRWIPPFPPIRNDLSVWKAILLDLHDNLIEAGLVQTADAGQLDIDGVSVLPADNTFAGYRMYRFDDALQATAPIFLRVQFGCAGEGMGAHSSYQRSRTIRVHYTLGVEVDGSGGFVGPTTESFGAPQSTLGITGSHVGGGTHYGSSFFCARHEDGFFGFFYGIGSRNKPFPHTYGSYYGATFALIVQRSTDDDGVPTGEGFSVFAPGYSYGNSTNHLWDDGVVPAALSQYVSFSGESSPVERTFAMRMGGNYGGVINGEIWTQGAFMATPVLRQLRTLITYPTNILPEGAEFTIELPAGVPRNFVALGNETSMVPDPLLGQSAAFAMLFE